MQSAGFPYYAHPAEDDLCQTVQGGSEHLEGQRWDRHSFLLTQADNVPDPCSSPDFQQSYIEPHIMFNAAEAALRGAPSSSAWEVSTFMSQFHTNGN